MSRKHSGNGNANCLGFYADLRSLNRSKAHLIHRDNNLSTTWLKNSRLQTIGSDSNANYFFYNVEWFGLVVVFSRRKSAKPQSGLDLMSARSKQPEDWVFTGHPVKISREKYLLELRL